MRDHITLAIVTFLIFELVLDSWGLDSSMYLVSWCYARSRGPVSSVHVANVIWSRMHYLIWLCTC